MAASSRASDTDYGLKPSDLDEIKRSFREFDLNNNGFITRDELKQCLKTANVVAVDAVVDSVLKQMDWDNDGSISFGEYLKFMSKIYRNEHPDLKRQLGNAGDNVGSASHGLH